MILILKTGCGKTSLILALAGHFDYSICVLNLSDQGLSDTALAQRLAEVPENSIVLLEDVDAAFVSRNSARTGTAQAQEGAPASETAFQGTYRKMCTS